MKRRLYFLLPDVASATRSANDLLLARVEDRNMHFLAKRGTDLGELHEASYLIKTDLMRGAGIGLAFGVIGGAILGYLIVNYPPEGTQPGLGVAVVGSHPHLGLMDKLGVAARDTLTGYGRPVNGEHLLLEARVGTFLRPDTTNRLIYTVVANMLIGTVGSALVIRKIVRRAEFPRLTTYGIARPLRIPRPRETRTTAARAGSGAASSIRVSDVASASFAGRVQVFEETPYQRMRPAARGRMPASASSSSSVSMSKLAPTVVVSSVPLTRRPRPGTG